MWRQLTIQRLTVAILFILLFAMAVRTPVDTDTWWHLRSGEYQVENRTVIRTGLFSSSMPEAPWINHSWGAQIIMHFVYQGAGGQGDSADAGSVGLAIMTALLAAGGMAFVYMASSGNVYVKSFAAVLGAAAAAVFWSPRPQMFTFFFSAIVYYILYLYKRQHVDRLWLIPLVMLIWGNLHGGFAVAFIFILGFIIGEAAAHVFGPQTPDVVPWRGLGKLVLVSAVSILVLAINPFGFKILTVPFSTVSIGVLQDFIQEWAAPNFHEKQTWPFIALLIGSLGFAGLSKTQLDWTDLALITGTGFMALTAGRNIAIFAIVATPVLARYVDAFLSDRGWQVRPVKKVTAGMVRLNWLLLLVIMFGALTKIVYAVGPETIHQAQQTRLPVDAAAYINESQPQGKMFNSYNWGGYLMFAVPDYPVYVDGRTDLYGDSFLREYLSVLFLSQGWQNVLDAQEIGFVVVEARGNLATALRGEPGWKVAYEDDLAVIFVRSDEQ